MTEGMPVYVWLLGLAAACVVGYTLKHALIGGEGPSDRDERGPMRFEIRDGKLAMPHEVSLVSLDAELVKLRNEVRERDRAAVDFTRATRAEMEKNAAATIDELRQLIGSTRHGCTTGGRALTEAVWTFRRDLDAIAAHLGVRVVHERGEHIVKPLPLPRDAAITAALARAAGDDKALGKLLAPGTASREAIERIVADAVARERGEVVA